MTLRPTIFPLWIRARAGLAAASLALAASAVWPLGTLPARAQAPAAACTADQLNAAVDAAAAELRTFSAQAQPTLKQQLAALREKYKWPEENYEDRALEHLQDGKLSMLDTQANELLTRIDTLGRPEENPGTDTCAAVNEVKAAVSELLSVMREKANYISVKVSAELGAGASPATVTAEAQPTTPPPAPPSPPAAAPAASPPPAPEKPTAKEAAPPVVSTIATAKQEAPKAPPAAKPPTTPAPEKIAKADPAPAPPKSAPPLVAAKPADASPSPTNQLPPPPPPPPQQTWEASPADAPPANGTEPYPGVDGRYAAREGEAYPAGSEPYGPPPTEEAGANGYTIEEIRDATKGFFGSISTSLASVIEHAFKKSGRPTAYILGNEGGGAFLAGLRYGEGTMYLRNGGTQKVYWHGPSIGSDVGADGSRTLFLIYRLNQPEDIYRQFTGIDGTAYLVGGVGLTFLKGGPVVMAPIRSGIGLRFGASLGYLRFTSHKTWNPF